MRARARAYVEAFAARTDDFEVIYASKALPITAAYRVMAEEGLSVDVASGGELYLALKGGRRPERIFMHGNNKTEAELELAFDAGHRLPGARLVRRDRAAPSGCSPEPAAAGRPDPGHARHQALHPLLHPDRPARLEVRLRARGRAGGRGGAARAGVRAASSWSASTPTSARRSSSSSPTRRRSSCSPTSSTSTAAC